MLSNFFYTNTVVGDRKTQVRLSYLGKRKFTDFSLSVLSPRPCEPTPLTSRSRSPSPTPVSTVPSVTTLIPERDVRVYDVYYWDPDSTDSQWSPLKVLENLSSTTLSRLNHPVPYYRG